MTTFLIAAALWLILGYIGAAMEFTKNLFLCPNVAYTEYWKDVFLFPPKMLLFGPIWLAIAICDADTREMVGAHGLWVPGKKSYAKAREFDQQVLDAIMSPVHLLRAVVRPKEEAEKIAPHSRSGDIDAITRGVRELIRPPGTPLH